MTCFDLVRFIDRDKSLRKTLNPEQMKRFRTWAQKVPSENQLGHLIPIQKIPRKQLGTYLTNLIPEFPQGEDSI
jgi:hypothetical protein